MHMEIDSIVLTFENSPRLFVALIVSNFSSSCSNESDRRHLTDNKQSLETDLTNIYP